MNDVIDPPRVSLDWQNNAERYVIEAYGDGA